MFSFGNNEYFLILVIIFYSLLKDILIDKIFKILSNYRQIKKASQWMIKDYINSTFFLLIGIITYIRANERKFIVYITPNFFLFLIFSIIIGCILAFFLSFFSKHNWWHTKECTFPAQMRPQRKDVGKLFFFKMFILNFFEEVVWRAYLINALKDFLTTFVALSVSSLSFCFLHHHFGKTGMIMSFVVGCVLTTWFVFTNGIVYVFCLHTSYNLLSLFLQMHPRIIPVLPKMRKKKKNK